MFKKILVILSISILSLLIVGCSEGTGSAIQNKVCEETASKTCLYLLNDGEIFKTFKDPTVKGSDQGIIIFEDSRGKTNYFSGSFLIIYND